jgi:hypothetical protein
MRRGAKTTIVSQVLHAGLVKTQVYHVPYMYCYCIRALPYVLLLYFASLLSRHATRVTPRDSRVSELRLTRDSRVSELRLTSLACPNCASLRVSEVPQPVKKKKKNMRRADGPSLSSEHIRRTTISNQNYLLFETI